MWISAGADTPTQGFGSETCRSREGLSKSPLAPNRVSESSDELEGLNSYVLLPSLADAINWLTHDDFGNPY